MGKNSIVHFVSWLYLLIAFPMIYCPQRNIFWSDHYLMFFGTATSPRFVVKFCLTRLLNPLVKYCPIPLWFTVFTDLLQLIRRTSYPGWIWKGIVRYNPVMTYTVNGSLLVSHLVFKWSYKRVFLWGIILHTPIKTTCFKGQVDIPRIRSNLLVGCFCKVWYWHRIKTNKSMLCVKLRHSQCKFKGISLEARFLPRNAVSNLP